MTEQAFIDEVLPHQDKIYRLARNYLCDADSQDVVQETMIRLWQKRHELPGYRSIQALAIVIARNMCLDKVKAKSYQNSSLNNIAEPATTQTPARALETKDEAALAHSLISRLPEQQRTIVHLRDVEGLEYEEIAAVVKMNVNTIRVNLSRARKTLREAIIKQHNYAHNGS
jgi:RNA polymerase sigma-70 factor (ECF subfamily)